MKRNLLKGIILLSTVALSSCATLSDVSNPKPFGDDVYYTKAKAGVSDSYMPDYVMQTQQDVVRNDDYYYYGDYESRIRRFSYASPFDYDDDFYESYAPYTPVSNQETATYAYDPNDYTYDPYYEDLGVYSAFDFGYGDYWGYDNYGYGLAYSTFIYSGGTRATHKKDYSYTNNNDGPIFTKPNYATSRYSGGLFGINAGKGQTASNSSSGGLVFTKGSTSNANPNVPTFTGMRPGGNNAVYPGRPVINQGSAQTSAVVAGTNRPIRPATDITRPQPQVQQPTFERSSPPSQSSSSSNSGGGGGGGAASGGGGRPVRP